METILWNILVGFASMLVGYLFGSIPNGILIGKIFYHSDPRTAGSKNSGGTNVARLYGKKAGIITIILDMIKVVIPLIAAWAVIKFSGLKDALPLWDDGVFYIYLAALGACFGHCWPLYVKFKGGKTVAVYCGFAIATSYFVTIFGVIAFFTLFFWKKYVSLASIVTSIVGVVGAWTCTILGIFFDMNWTMWGFGSWVPMGWEFASVLTVIAIILIIRHIPNIQRLMNGTERKVGEHK